MSPEEKEKSAETIVGEQAAEHPEDLRVQRRFVGTWKFPLLVAGFTLIWVFVIYLLIGERPRKWDYGVYPYVPASSIESTQKVRLAPKTPNQVEYPTGDTGGRNEVP